MRQLFGGIIMGIKAKSAVCVLCSAAVLFGGCTEQDETLKHLDKTDISYIMNTDLTCVNGEELYIKTPFYISSDILIRYENPVYFDGRRLYFFRYSITDAETNEEKTESGNAVAARTAVIAFYDTEKNEINLILEEENKKHINYSFAAFKDSYLYYYRSEQDSAARDMSFGAALYRINIEDKKPEKIADIHAFNGGLPKDNAVQAGKSIFFEFTSYSDEQEGEQYTVYSYNTENGEYKEFKTGMSRLMKYKDGIAYLKDGSVYSLDPDSGSEVLLYAPEPSDIEQNMTFYSNGEKIFYQLHESDEESSSFQIGYISEGKKKKTGDKIGEAISSIRGESMLLLTLSGGDNLIYDEKHDCFARISLNRENSAGFPAENSVMFVCCDKFGQNPILYLYSREKVKTQLPSAADAKPENYLDHIERSKA